MAHLCEEAHAHDLPIPPPQNLPRVRMPRQNLAGVRIELQKRAGRGGNALGEESNEVLEGARTAGPLLTRAPAGYSPFVTPDINLMIAKELTEDTEGFTPQVWDASTGDFVERKDSTTASKPDDEPSMGDDPADSEDTGLDSKNNPWITRVAKRDGIPGAPPCSQARATRRVGRARGSPTWLLIH